MRRTISQVKDTIATHEADIDRVIAFDCDLKNAEQRKSKRMDLIYSNPELASLCSQLAELDYQLEKAEIDLSLIFNQFAIAKLEKRQTIAQLETESRLTA